MLDRYWSGSTARISPEAPVPIVKVNDIEDRPGGAANVAVNAAALGAKVTLVGMVGKDEAAAILSSKLSARNVNCDFVEVASHDTITKLRVMSRSQQLIRLDFEQSFNNIETNILLDKIQSHLHNCDVVVLSDYAKGCLSDTQAIINAANKANKPVIVDPKGSDFSKYRGAFSLTPNMAEFEMVQGPMDTELDIEHHASALIEQFSLSSVLVTRSEKGMSLYSNNNALHLPAKAKEVFDVTGAGDTVIATFASSIAAGLSLYDACSLANHAASIVVGKLGTSTVSTTELALALNEQLHLDGGVLNAEQLLLVVNQAKAKAETVVMTNGCFDILHSGHVAYLTEAAKLGHRLIVAVNADESVTALKGEGRPINNLSRRMAVLAGLSAVDWVVAFSEDTPEQLISTILPDILVKGGDYKVDDIAGGRAVAENGGEVLVLNFEEGVSTTGIIQQIVSAKSATK